jgi:hypothetical protein
MLEQLTHLAWIRLFKKRKALSSGSSVVERAKTKYFRFAVVSAFLNNSKFLFIKNHYFYFFGIFKMFMVFLSQKRYPGRFCGVSCSDINKHKMSVFARKKNIFVLTLLVEYLVFPRPSVVWERVCDPVCFQRLWRAVLRVTHRRDAPTRPLTLRPPGRATQTASLAHQRIIVFLPPKLLKFI